MRLKLSLWLPAAQLVLAIALLQWGYHYPYPAWLVGVEERHYWSATSRLLCIGINAPAFRIGSSLARLLSGDPFPGKFAGFYLEDWVSLACLAILWYLVARTIPSLTLPFAAAQTKPRTGKIPRNLLVSVFGLVMLLEISTHNVITRNPRNGNGAGLNFYGALMEQTLWFVWSLVLIFVPAREIVKAVQQKPSNQEPDTA